MRWQLTFAIALAALPAVALAQQGQAAGDSVSTQDTSGRVTQQVETGVSAGEVSTDSTHRMKSDTTTNQTESGVVNKKGKSTLGPNIKKVKPTQGRHLKEPYKKGARAKSDTTQGLSDTTAAPSASDTTGTQLNEPYVSGRQQRTGADTTHFREPYLRGGRSGADTTRSTQTSAGEVSGAASDTTQNQTQSGVEDSSGASTLGPNVKKVRPTQGAAVTSKGDTLRRGGDTTSGGGRSKSDTTGSQRGLPQPPR